MSRSVNRAYLIGRAGARAEVRTTTSGRRVATFTLATSRGGGNSPEKTDWHRIVAWDDLAESAHRGLEKGQRVYVEGRLEHRTWKDRSGGQRHTTEVVAEDLILLDAAEAGASPRTWRDVLAEEGPEEGQNGFSAVDEELPF